MNGFSFSLVAVARALFALSLLRNPSLFIFPFQNIAIVRDPIPKMRLIEVDTMELREFFEPDIPEFAILSYIWGEEEEVDFSGFSKFCFPPESRICEN